MEYILGIDSGASSSEALITDCDGKVIYNQIHTAVNCNLLGLQKTSENLLKIIKTSLQKLKNEVSSIVIGISGARDKRQRNYISNVLKEKTRVRKIYIYPDTAIAFHSVFEHGETNCGILIAGTGSILYYKDSNGQIKQSGGWGRIIGDEGSGYWIGCMALKKTVMYYDGINTISMLVDALKKKFGLNKTTLINKIYSEKFEIQKLAETVFDCAVKGDKAANEIIKSAAENLAKLFRVFRKKKYTIALCGSLFTKQDLLEKYLKRIAKTNYPNVKLIKAKRSPVWGAIKLGKLSLAR